jgi:hypothetical protein
MQTARYIRYLSFAGLLTVAVLSPTRLTAQEDGNAMRDEGTTMGHDGMSQQDRMSKEEVGAATQGMMFMGAGSERATGDYEIVEASGKRQIRFTDDFSVGDAPDLHVVLSVGEQADHDALDLGKLQRRQGPQAYDLPADVDLGHYRKLLIWSKKLNRAVAGAELPGPGGSRGHM